MADKRKGIAFQNFVAMVEKAFAMRDNVTVECPKYIIDADSESRREFDVFITSRYGAHHQLFTAIEVKDEKTPIGVPEVEAFIGKCDRNNVHHKVMVSSKGSNPAADKLAAKRGVTLMTMAQAEAFDWLIMDAITERRRTFEATNIHVEMAEGVAPPEGSWDLLDEVGEVVTLGRLMEFVHEHVPWPEGDDLPDGPVSVLLEIQNEFTVRTSDKALHKVGRVVAQTSYTVSIEAKPISLHTYKGAGAGEGVNLAFASTDMKLGDVNGKLMFTRMPDQSTDISWQANPAERKAPKAMPRQRKPKSEGKP